MSPEHYVPRIRSAYHSALNTTPLEHPSLSACTEAHLQRALYRHKTHASEATRRHHRRRRGASSACQSPRVSAKTGQTCRTRAQHASPAMGSAVLLVLLAIRHRPGTTDFSDVLREQNTFSTATTSAAPHTPASRGLSSTAATHTPPSPRVQQRPLESRSHGVPTPTTRQTRGSVAHVRPVRQQRACPVHTRHGRSSAGAPGASQTQVSTVAHRAHPSARGKSHRLGASALTATKFTNSPNQEFGVWKDGETGKMEGKWGNSGHSTRDVGCGELWLRKLG